MKKYGRNVYFAELEERRKEKFGKERRPLAENRAFYGAGLHDVRIKKYAVYIIKIC